MSTANHLDLGDSNSAFWDERAGEPVRLVHASFSADWFEPLAGQLSPCRVVRTHREGYGESRDESGQLSLLGHARHLAEVLRARGIERTHVVGHASGASIALQLVSTYPQLVHSLVLLETAFPDAPDESKSNALRLAIEAAKTLGVSASPGSAMRCRWRTGRWSHRPVVNFVRQHSLEG